MITPELARIFCIKAHKTQWRRLRDLFDEEYTQEIAKLPQYGEHLLTNGNKAVWYYVFPGKWFIAEPYHVHPIAVADMLSTEQEKVVAYLHDVIEDTDWELEQKSIGDDLDFEQYHLVEPDGTKHLISTCTAFSLLLLTHKPSRIPYLDYIKNIANSLDRVAIKVKLADITSNLIDNPSDRQREKYKKAMKILLQSI
jgi:hypothetical protein